MDKTKIEKINAQIVVNKAMNIFNCKNKKELKELCHNIIIAIDYLNS